MPCYFPLQAWRGEGRGDSGKREIVFKSIDAVCADAPFYLPCGRCIGCRLERSRQWAIRCVHEASLHERNCFITLTYAELKTKSLVVRDWQLFMKRLRKRFPRERIRFFHCGEYGEVCKDCSKSEKFCECAAFIPSLGRPHFHACLFNFDFADKKLWKMKGGNRLYTSVVLNEVWGLGYGVIGDVSFDSAAYVARYIMKKINGEPAADHYGGRKPEYVTMSRGGNVRGGKGGIGKAWFEKFKGDVFPHDFVVIRGKEMPPPKFYGRLFELEAPEEFERIKAARDNRARAVPYSERHGRRLDDKRKVKEAQIKCLSRNMDVEK